MTQVQDTFKSEWLVGPHELRRFWCPPHQDHAVHSRRSAEKTTTAALSEQQFKRGLGIIVGSGETGNRHPVAIQGDEVGRIDGG